MPKTKTAFIALITTTILLTGCANNQHMADSSKKTARRQPRFIADISIEGNGRSKIKTNIPSSHIARSEEKKQNHNNKPAEQYIQTEFRKNDPIRDKYASIIGIFPKMITNAPLYSFIDTWYGVPYRMGGNDMSGIDCSAFVQRLYENVFGTNLVRTAFEQFSACHRIEKTEDLREGDLVFFHSYTYSRSRRGRKSRIIGHRISHVGVYLANDRFVHASTTNGVMISSLKEEYWARKFAGAGQIPRS